MPDLKNAVIYARYSSYSQTEQSIEGQLHDAYAFAEKNGYRIIQEYIDRALTGTSDNRPAFQRMIKDAAKNIFQYVIVWKQDRFARNRYDSAIYKRELKKHGVKVLSVMENITDSPEGIILEGLLEAMAEYYSANLGENIKRGRHESVRKGLFPGGPVPFGFMVQDKRLVPDPRTAPIAKEIFERYAATGKMQQIVDDLNQRGIRTIRGDKFQLSSISHILHNRTYTGDYYYGETFLPQACDAIIDHELFNKCAAILAKHKANPAAGRCPKSKSYLLGKFFCGDCGSRMIGSRGVSRSGTYFYYACKGRTWEHKQCTMTSIPKRDFERAVCRVASDFLLDKRRKTLEIIVDKLMEAHMEEEGVAELKELEMQRNHIERDLEKLVDSLIDMPEAARPRISARMELLEQQLKDTDDKLAKKQSEHSTHFDREEFIRFLRGILSDYKSEPGMEFIINTFINSVYLYHDGRMVVYFNQLPGMPYLPSDDPPGTDSWKDGKQIFQEDSYPAEISKLQDFPGCFCLYSYGGANQHKQKQNPPQLFFLHGRVGIMLWRHSLPKTRK